MVSDHLLLYACFSNEMFVLDTLTQGQKRLQEAKFEVMTSEASYFKSLTVLDKLFALCPLFSDDNILSRDERKILFGNVNTGRCFAQNVC